MRTFRLRKYAPDAHLILGGETGFIRASEVLKPVAGPSRIIEGGDRIKRRRLSWDPSPSPDVVGYRIYWNLNQNISYNSEYIDIGQKIT
jgi:hypothetical protein